MKDFKDKVVVITGAGSGMGRELALQFAQKRAKVALNDWNHDTLMETLKMVKEQGGEGIARRFDVSDRKAMYGFAKEVVNYFGQVDVVINNAGMTIPGISLEYVEYDDFEKVVNVNMWGVIYGTKAFLPHLKKRPEAAILNTSSVFGILGYPGQGPYCATKFAVRGFTETLRGELKLEGVDHVQVCCIHPGGIKTNIVNNIDHSKTNISEEERKAFSAQFDENAPTTAADAAAQIIGAIESHNPKLLIGKDAWFIDKITRLLPVRYVNWLLKRYEMTDEAKARMFQPVPKRNQPSEMIES